MNPRFEHKTIMDGRYHVVTSPDESGVYVAEATEAEALRKAKAIFEIIQEERRLHPHVEAPEPSFKAFG